MAGLLDNLGAELGEDPLPIAAEVPAEKRYELSEEEIDYARKNLGPNGIAALEAYLQGEPAPELQKAEPVALSTVPTGNPLSPSVNPVRAFTKKGAGANYGNQQQLKQVVSRQMAPAATPLDEKVRAISVGDVVASAIDGGAAPTPEALSRSQPVVDLNQALPDLKKRSKSVVDLADSALEQFTKNAPEILKLQEERNDKRKKANEGLALINQVVRQDIELVQPTIQDAQARINSVDRRLAELAEMSPLKAKIKGAFDPNWNADRLNNIRAQAVGQLESATNQFRTTATLQSQLYDISQTDFKNEDEYLAAVMQTFDLKNGIAKDHLGMAQQAFNAAAAGIAANSTALAAMDAAEEAELNTLDASGINGAIGQGRKSKDGMVLVNGVKIPIVKLQTRAKQLEQQELAIKSARLSLQSQQLGIQSQQMQLSQQRMNQLVGNMSLSDFRNAMKNGGVYRGVKLDSRMLEDGYRAQLTLQELSTNDNATIYGAKGWAGAVKSFHANVNQTFNAFRSINGSALPTSFVQQHQKYARRLTELNEQIRNAPADQRAAVAMFATKELEKLQAENGSVVESLSKQLSSDPAGQKTIASWLSGQPQNPSDALDGLISLSKNGTLPLGVSANSEAGKLIIQAGNIQKDLINQHPKANKEQLKRLVREKVQEGVGSSWVAAVGASTLSSLTGYARTDGHPAGLISDDHWRQALNAGDAQAYQRMGTELGLSTAQVKELFNPKNGGAQSALAKQIATERNLTYQALQSNLADLATTYTLRKIDELVPATQGVRASKSISDYMNSDTFQGRMGQQNQALGMNNFGQFMVSQVGGGNLSDSFANRASQFKRISMGLDYDYARERRNAGVPATKVGQLAAMPYHMNGLEPVDQQTLERFVTQIGDPAEARNIILGPRLKDPNLARIQSIAAKEWDAARQRVEQASLPYLVPSPY